VRHIRCFLLLLFLLPLLQGYSRSIVFPDGSKPAGMANAFVSQYHVFSVFQNQAGLAALDRSSISVFYENRYLIPQLSNKAAVMVLATQGGNFALQLNSFGPPQWAESNIGLAYSRFLNDRLSLGIQLNYFGTRLAETNTLLMSAGFETGAIYRVSENTFIGLHIANPYTPPINTTVYKDQIPWRVKFGGHTHFADDFIFSYELEKLKGLNTILKAGAEWEVADSFFVRGGMSTPYNAELPMRFYAGLGFETGFFTFDTSFAYHNALGYVPSVSLIFSFF